MGTGDGPESELMYPNGLFDLWFYIILSSIIKREYVCFVFLIDGLAFFMKL